MDAYTIVPEHELRAMKESLNPPSYLEYLHRLLKSVPWQVWVWILILCFLLLSRLWPPIWGRIYRRYVVWIQSQEIGNIPQSSEERKKILDIEKQRARERLIRQTESGGMPLRGRGMILSSSNK